MLQMRPLGEGMDSIPLVDLAAQHAEIAAEVTVGWQEIVDRTGFVGGPKVAAFESEYADFIRTAHCVGVGNGTDAIEIALRALGVGPGDECIVPANTFIATAEAISRAGAVPVFVDCAADDTYLIDTAAVEAAVTPRTRAIVPVHLYGQAAAVERLVPVARRAGAFIVEDAAQSQGARRHGVHAGSLGDAAATSFYPGKNLGAYGDAGAVLTGSAEVASRLRMIRDHGSVRKYEHEILGFNSRLDAIQAVVLSAKLRRLDKWNAERRAAAARYDDLLAEVPRVTLPRTAPGNEHVWHLYVVRVEDRGRVLKELQAAGVGTGIHYPVPVHLTGVYAGLGYAEGAFPVAERASREVLSLPLFPGITPDQQQRVASALRLAAG
jgi:dTDP-4-amino-4,6-dideoxygalactose transaminase